METQIRDLRKRQYFRVDDEYLNGYAKLCGIYATGVYLSFCRHANKGQQSWPGLQKIADELDISKPMVIKATKELEAWNLIRVIRSKDSNTKQQNVNIYELIDKSFWKAKPSKQGLPSPESMVLTTPSKLETKKPSKQGLQEGLHILKGNTTEGQHSSVRSPQDEAGKIIEVFYKTINPVINWGNTTNRKAAEDLIKAIGFQQTMNAAIYACKNQDKKYCPTITTPYQLKEKLSALRKFKQDQERTKKTHAIL